MITQALQHTLEYDDIGLTSYVQPESLSQAFANCISLPPRTQKPRAYGLTFVLDQGMSVLHLQDFIADAAPYIDLIKLAWGTSRLFHPARLGIKIQTLRDHDIHVCPGGTLLELAIVHNCVAEFFQEVVALGFDCIEVSDGTISMLHITKLHLIRAARRFGLRVVSEVGKKMPAEDRHLPLETRISQAAAELEAGAWKVIVEGRESGGVGVYDTNGDVQEECVEALVRSIGLENLIFEAPRKDQQSWFCKRYGNRVNLGNIAPADVIPVETLRYGLRADTMKVYH